MPDFNEMLNFWNDYVDQIVFVKYNPWENSYIVPKNNITTACSDLWRRMFIWWDKKINPCDVDYKSNLSTGKFDGDISNAWLSEGYQNLRNQHLTNNRQNISPCKSCTVI